MSARDRIMAEDEDKKPEENEAELKTEHARKEIQLQILSQISRYRVLESHILQYLKSAQGKSNVQVKLDLQ